jgi:hypothetical protein
MDRKRINFALDIPWPNLSQAWAFARKWLLPNPGTLVLMVVLALAMPSLAAPHFAPEATSTSTISYQGRLADSAGNPLTGMYNLEFRIYDVPTGGAPLWEEFWTGGNSVAVSDGLFNVMLGSINTTLASAIEGHDELYLGITVGTDSEMVPRVQLGSVPFSMQAMTVPDGSITTAKIADGAVTAAKQSITTYHAQDASFVRVQGQGQEALISEFHFDGVPAGDLEIIVTLIGGVEPGANGCGRVWIEVGGTWPDCVATHVLQPQAQLTLHGIVQGFPGGSLTVAVKAFTEVTDTNIFFGAENGDSRFGRRITVVAGQ